MNNKVNGYLPEPMAEESEQLVPNNVEISPEIITGTSEVPSPFNLAPLKCKSVPTYKLIAMYKSRLRFCISLEFTLFFIVLLKCSEDIFDRMDIFILKLEELLIPKPHIFDYVYLSSIIFAISALRALNKNNLGSLKSYAAGVVVLGICPLLIAAIYYFNDIYEYAEKKEEANVLRWKKFPVACYYYGFIIVAIQIHLFSLYFCAKLLKIWRSKMKKV